MIGYAAGLLVWKRCKLVFLDVACIDQSNHVNKAEGLVSMGAFLKSSKRMLVLWDLSYPKSAGPLPPDLHFSLAFQRREARFWGCRGHRRRVLHAAAHDTRTLECMHLPFHPCPCGEALPSRTHVTFSCPVLADQSLAGRTEAEQRLLVHLLTVLPSPEWAMPDVSQELLLALSTARSVQGRLLVATDGSSLQDTAQPSMYWFSHASFGIAFSLQSKFSGPVPGLDRTPAAAERYALLVVAHAAAILEAPVLILTDNQAFSVSFLHAARATSSQLGGYWRHVFSLLPANSSCVWVPAHDRHSEWLCPVAGLTADEARALNRAADEAATSCTAFHADTFVANQRSHRAATDWARKAVLHQEDHTKTWHDAVFASAVARRKWREL